MSSSVVTPNASACSNRPGNAWVWASMSPGSSVWPGASTTVASTAVTSGPTSTITPSRTSTATPVRTVAPSNTRSARISRGPVID